MGVCPYKYICKYSKSIKLKNCHSMGNNPKNETTKKNIFSIAGYMQEYQLTTEINTNQQLSTTINYYQLLLTTINI